jgi:hybrid cluster-associated redox disulfide protein
MDRYMKAFVVMSMVYLLVGAVLGISLAWNMASLQLRFAHVHLNLLGFMAMMIFGVGYFILPRFSGRTLRLPGLVAVHFWASNLSLLGMVVLYSVWDPGWLVCSILQAFSAALFLGNVGLSVLIPPREEVPVVRGEGQGPVISGETKVAELLERWPHLRELLVAQGIQALSDPQHLEHVRKLGVTLGMMARRHGLDEGALLARVASVVGGHVQGGEAGASHGSGGIGKDSVIGEVIRRYPQTEAVFRKFYGEGCFSCPGQAFETIAQSAMMHNVELGEILSELNRAAGQGKGPPSSDGK